MGLVLSMSEPAIDKMLYGDRSNFLATYLQNQIQAIGPAFNDMSQRIYSALNNSYNFVTDKLLQFGIRNELASAGVNYLDNYYQELLTWQALQQANPTMQRWVMSHPQVRQHYLDQNLDGYSDSYSNVFGKEVGKEDYNYRRATSGVMGDDGYSLYFEDLMLLLQETSNFNDFSHLKKWDDSEKKIQKAKDAVLKLRQQTKGYFDIITELKEAEKRRETNTQKMRSSMAFSERLEDLKARFLSIATNENHQERGYDLEKLLNDLFILFDLDPKSSFKITGEQIDGAFTFDNQDYLLESKWQKKQLSASDLYEFGGKISGKLKNTLGLYISLEGFSNDCLKVENPILKSMILLDGLDLMMVLDGRIKLNDLIYLKRRHASQTGEIFYRISGV